VRGSAFDGSSTPVRGSLAVTVVDEHGLGFARADAVDQAEVVSELVGDVAGAAPGVREVDFTSVGTGDRDGGEQYAGHDTRGGK